MINVDLIRRVQASILDETRPFNMSSWSFCIAGHTLQICGVDDEWIRFRSLEADTYAIVNRAAALLCIDRRTAERLFTSGDTFPLSISRREAVDALERLLIAEAARCAAGSALEPRSRSARAENASEPANEVVEEAELVLA